MSFRQTSWRHWENSLNIAQALALSSSLERNSDSARLDAEVLLAFVLDKNREYLYTWPEKILTLSQQSKFRLLIEKRKQGQPIAYLIGQKEFWSLTLTVSDATIIPRPDTERLVELALELKGEDALTALDLGTGTGAIALALAHERNNWQIIAVDNHAPALMLAEENKRLLKIANVQTLLSDWFCEVDEHFDLIVSNPPYIDEMDEHLQQGDVRFEPRSALVASERGLGDIMAIAEQSRSYLNKAGLLLFEHGSQQAEEVRAVLNRFGYDAVTTFQDYSHNDRVTGGYWHG